MRTSLFPLLALFGFLTAACSLGAPENLRADSPAGAVSPVAPGSAAANLNEHDIDALTQQFVGVWRSVYDEREVITINADGSWVSSYDGNAAPADRWMVFAGNAPPPGLTQTFDPTKHYIQVVRVDWPPLVAEIGDIGPNDFETFYLGNGRRNAYTRVR